MSEPHLLDRRVAYSGRVFRVGIDRLRLPDGRMLDFEIIRHSGGSVVAPITDDDDVLMIRQYRYTTDGWLLELPAGKLEPGEGPEACARRELEEETGWRASELTPLGPIRTSPGFTDEILHLFMARGLEEGTQALDASELLTVESLPLEEAVAMARDGRLEDAKTVCGVLRAAVALGR